MRNMLVVAAIALLSAPAYSQEPTIVDACLKVAELETGRPSLAPESIQAFPELSPPRVQMDIGTHKPEGASTTAQIMDILDAISDGADPSAEFRSLGSIRCEFQSSTPPFGLTAFSCSSIVYCPMYLSSERQRYRLEEMQILLAREGF